MAIAVQNCANVDKNGPGKADGRRGGRRAGRHPVAARWPPYVCVT